MSAGLVGNSQAQGNTGQGLSPAPFQNGASENEQGFYSDFQPVSGNADSAADNSSDRKNEVENDRNQEAENLFQNKQSGIPGSNFPANSFSGSDAQQDGRNANEVKNGNQLGGDLLGGSSRLSSGSIDQERPKITQSARIASPANQASFDAGNYSVPHVQNEQENNQSATCAKSPEVEEKPNRLTGRELTEWAIKNYAVDPIQSSKNRWKIRLRCRKTGCKHEDHLGLKTVSFMSDSAFKKLTRSERKYELWKKAILAENAATLRTGN